MASDDEDTTYSYVESSGRASSKPRARTSQAPAAGAQAPSTARTASKPPPDDEIDDPESDVEASRNVLEPSHIADLIEQGEHERVCDLLGPVDRAATLSPRLAQLYILARGELAKGSALADLPHLTMETSGAVLGLRPRSRASRLLAKRLLGLSAADVRQRMPGAAVRIALIAVALAVGVIVGWVAGPGGVDILDVFDSMTR